MSFDATAMGRAARQLDDAVRYADAAINADVPNLAGRRQALDEVRSRLGDAADWSDSVAVDLRRTGVPLEDAIAAVDALSARSRAIRESRSVARNRAASTYRATVDSARRWQASLDLAADGARAVQDGTAHAWITRSLADGASADAARTVRMLADGDAFAGLDAVKQAVLRRIDVDRPDTIELARATMQADENLAARAVIDHVLARADAGEAIDAELVRVAADRMTSTAGAVEVPLPDAVRRGSGLVALDDLDHQQLKLFVQRPARSEAAAALARVVDMPPSSMTDTDRATAVVLADALDHPEAHRLSTAHHAHDGSLDDVLLDAWVRRTGELDIDEVIDGLHRSSDPIDAARRLSRIAPRALDGIGDDTWRYAITQQLSDPGDAEVARSLVDAVRMARSGGPDPADLRVLSTAMSVSRALSPAETRSIAVLANLPDGVRPEQLGARGVAQRPCIDVR